MERVRVEYGNRQSHHRELLSDNMKLAVQYHVAKLTMLTSLDYLYAARAGGSSRTLLEQVR